MTNRIVEMNIVNYYKGHNLLVFFFRQQIAYNRGYYAE